MVTKLYIDNFCGISAPIKLDFIAKSRNKNSTNSIIKIEEGVYINKLAGIIGGNASGKTSILKAVNLISGIITSPILQFDIEDKLLNLQELLEKNPELDKSAVINDVVNRINSSVDITEQNLRRKKENTNIEIEMYIPSDDKELDGYYTYKITFNGEEKRIVKEIFEFRNHYKGSIKTIINIENAKQGQVYYINNYYENLTNIESGRKLELEEKYKYCNIFVKHYVRNSAIIDTSENCNSKDLKFMDWYRKSPEFFIDLIRVVDPKIKDVTIDTDKKQEELKFILSDGSKITRNMLSTGTERFLNLIRYVIEVIEKNGTLFVDEIEQNLHKDLVELIIKLFNEATQKNAQIIFTTLSPEIFDIYENDKQKIFKQDAVFVINSSELDIQIEKLIDIKIDGKRVKGDASVANLYKNRKISCHPDKEQIDLFVNKFKNAINDF